MSTSKYIDKICCAVLAVALILTVLCMNAGSLGIQTVNAAVGYASRLFNTSTVHTIDIVMDDWDSFIEQCSDEEYADCTVTIDGEAYRHTAIRAKGNTSLTSVEAYGNNRYSFKIEFDHYDDGGSYYGLDKLCLNNIIQDNTYMKDFLTYQLMREFGADAPLCSYSYITVNGDDWGLYLAVEGVEESFLQRSYGSDYGQLYKPDSMDMGGGRGNGRDFDIENFDFGEKRQNGPFASANDVSLIYTDDEFDSYANIFESAKTNLSDADKARLIESLKKLNNAEDIENVVNLDEVIRYFVVHNFVLNFDSYTGNMIHNYYLYENDGQLSMIPWDYNLAFGGFESRSDTTNLVNYPIDTPVSGGTIDSRPMLAWIFSSDEYTDLYHQYFAEFITQCFDSGYFTDLMDSMSSMIAPYVESDPTKFCKYEEFEKGVSTLKEFCLLRAESVNGQLDGTIPSTSEEQTQDSSTLVDASALSVSDMGSMGNMRGGGMPGRQEGFPDSDNAGPFGDRPGDRAGRFTRTDRQHEERMMSNEPMAVEALNPFNGSSPPDMQGHNPANNHFTGASFLLLGISIIILLLGIATALLFRRRHHIGHI